MNPLIASAKWLKNPTWGNLVQRLSRSAGSLFRLRQPRTQLTLEPLEDRTLLSVSYSVDGNDVKFSGAKNDNVYLEVQNGDLLYNTDGTSAFTHVTNNGSNVQVNASSTITFGSGAINVGTLYLVGITGSGGKYTTNGSIQITGSLNSSGQELDFTASGSISVSDATSANAGLIIDTSSTTDHAGAISFTAPTITIGAYAQLLATGVPTSSSDTADPNGAISLTATNQEADPTLAFWNFLQTLTGQVSHDATITIGSSAILKGSTVTAAVTAGDNEVLSSAEGFPLFGQDLSQLTNFFNDIVDLPISVVVKKSSAKLKVNSGAQIQSSGDTSLTTNSLSDALGEAIYTSLIDKLRGGAAGNSGFAAGVSYASSDAETTVNGSAEINAGGKVTITSTAESDSKMTARVTQNGGLAPEQTNPNNVQAALGSTVAYITSKTTVDEGAIVNGAGNVSITASGTRKSTTNVTTASYGDGKVGLTAAVTIANSDVETHVNGQVSSGSVFVPSAWTFNPFLSVNFANSSIQFPTAPGYSTGDSLVYNSGLGGAIPGLVSGQVYYAIVNSSNPNAVQLAETQADAENGNFIHFKPYPTLSGGGITVPITTVDTPDNTIQFDFDSVPVSPGSTQTKPLFTEGQQVTYNPAAQGNYLGYNDSNGNLIGALSQGIYTIHIVNGTADSSNLYSIQLKDSTGNVVPLNNNPVLTTPDGKKLQVSAFDTASNTITLDPQVMSALGVTLSNGEQLTYTEALDLAVSGLSDGQQYYTIYDPSTPNVIQLATSLSEAQAANPAVQRADPYLIWTNNGTPETLSITAVDVPTNVLEFTTNPAITDGTAVVYHEVPGKPIGGLTDGATYYAYNQTNSNFDSSDPLYFLVLKSTPSASASPISLSLLETLTDNNGNVYNILGNDSVHNTLNIVAQDGSVPTIATGTALTYGDCFGLSIGGLINGQMYYAAIAPTQPIPGVLLLALADTPEDAAGDSPTVVSLQSALPLGTLSQAYMSGSDHTLLSTVGSGLTVTSTLTNTDLLSIGSSIGSTPTLQQLLTQADLAFKPSAWNQYISNTFNWSQQQSAFGPQQAPSWSLASSAAWFQVTNTSLVEVGSSAVLKSTGDTTIQATTTESAQPQVNAAISKASTANAGTSTAIGVGVLLAFYNTTTQAIVDSNAHVDASGKLSVDAETTYPWAFQVLNANAHLGHDEGNNILGSLGTITGGTLGLNNLLVNTWVDVGTQGKSIDKTASVSFSWSEFTNTTVAQIAAGAQINQDASLQTSTQTVSVTANTSIIQTGFAGLVYLFLTPAALLKSARNKAGGGSALADFNDNNVVNPQSKTASVGGSVGYVSMNNTTKALIGGSDPNKTAPTGSTKINYGNNSGTDASDSGLNVQANESTEYIQISQGGGDSEGVAVTGTLSLPTITTTTIAQIASGTDVTSNANTTGDVNVSADDILELITVSGAVLISANKEIGLSSSVNTISRTVSALIGDPINQNPAASSNFHVGGNINVNATAGGTLVSASLAASVTNVTNQQGVDPGSNAKLPEGSWGWGFSGDFTWVKFNDTVTAAINDSGTFVSAANVKIARWTTRN